jgi:hypothetical protein
MANNGLKVRLLYLCVGMLLGSVTLVLAQTKLMEVEGDLDVTGDFILGGVVDGDLNVGGDFRVSEWAFAHYLWVDGFYGEVGIGTNSPIDTLTIEDNRPVIAIQEISTSPPNDDTGYAKFYVDSGEMYVLDDTDNDTQLSSHADPRNYGDPVATSFEDLSVELPFSFHHKNRLLGKGAVVDLAAAVRDLEAITGKSYTTVYGLPEPATEELLDRYDWIEIPIEEAFEQAEVMVPETVAEFDFNPDTLQVTQVEVPTGGPSEVGTGTYRNELNDDVRFNRENGKFYSRPTFAEIPQGATPDLPLWIADRLPPLE